ncbi:MAG TPA: NAD(P)/FAD-dependent oxidoreductase [Mycobacteriales bacterium]|nr:NAD(P)/FAD-dependent oxidoreductase [Mycobacteriales bacterium]
MSDRDGRVVVIGAGHNGLVAACYLARAGRDVEVVERDTVIGGAVSTVERFPGYRMDRGSSAHILVRHTGIVEDLGLAEMGLDYQDLDPWGFAPFPDGNLTFWVDLDRTCASIESLCGSKDAEAYRRFVTEWSARNQLILEAFGRAPSLPHLGRLALGLRRTARVGSVELARQFLTTGDALLDSLFDDERLKTALAWLGSQSGPPMTEIGSADHVGWTTLLHTRAPGHPRGGSGGLSTALGRRFTALGGQLRLGDGATQITTAGSRVTGVRTASGEHLAASVVVTACHVLTALELLPDSLSWLARSRRGIRVSNGGGMVVRLATTDLPRYPGATAESHRALQLLAPSRQALRTAHGQYVAGLPPERPAALAMTFSAFDDSLAPAGQHNVSVWGQWHPYALSNGESWDSIGAREGDKLVAAVEAVAPGFSESVQQVHVQTPLDLERELGLVQGHVMHVEMSLDQMFRWRPSPELARGRVPGLTGLYLSGASMHPGGGVFGVSGRTSAAQVLADRSSARPAGAASRLRRQSRR